MTQLFDRYRLRSVRFRNRIVVSPMCMYSAREGKANQWHLIHAATRAIGGAGCFMVEATAVEPVGRISPLDLGLWNEGQQKSLAPIAAIINQHGCVPGIQFAHAGRKGSCSPPWEGGGQLVPGQGGWETVAPSPLPFGKDDRPPRALVRRDLQCLAGAFAEAAGRALEAGFQVLEIHMAHGYLLHSFLSPLSNRREDEYGGSFEGRIRFPLEVVDAVRHRWPDHLPLWVRLTSRDWMAGGWTLEESVEFARRLRTSGVDLVDCSSGFLVPGEAIDFGPGFQVGFAHRIRCEAGMPTAAVGGITDSRQADTILRSGQADLVCMARQLLREPYWPLRAAHELGQEASWPKPYLRGGY